MTCPVNDDFNPYTQLDYLEKLHFDHQKRIEEEAIKLYIEEYVATGNVDYAKHVYFTHLKLYLCN